MTIILVYSQSYGQYENISSSELDSMYFKTLQSQYLFLVNGTIYVENNEFTERLKNIEELEYFKFMSTDELIKESLKTKKELDVIRVVHRVISKDTIDVNIGYLSVKARRVLHFNKGLKFKKADFKLSCGGTNGYQPTGRFVYNLRDKKWSKLETDE